MVCTFIRNIIINMHNELPEDTLHKGYYNDNTNITQDNLPNLLGVTRGRQEIYNLIRVHFTNLV